MRARVIVALLVGVVLAACEAPLRPLPSTVCHEAHRGAVAPATSGDEQIEAREPTDAEWIALLTDDEEGRPSSCEELLSRAPPLVPQCDGAAPRAIGTLHPVPPRILARLHRDGEDDVLWVATHRTPGGQHVGPVALVRRTRLGLEVQAIGRHVGPAEQIEARVLRAGSMLVVSMESEHDGDRVADLLVRSGGALVPAALDDPDAGCQAPARLVLRRQREERGPDGWTRRSVRTAVLDEDGSSVVVREHLSVRELDARDPDAPPRASHDADGIRRLSANGARLRADRGELVSPPRRRETTPAAAPRPRRR